MNSVYRKEVELIMNKEIICCELVGNLLHTRYGYDAVGIEDFKIDRPKGEGFLPSLRN